GYDLSRPVERSFDSLRLFLLLVADLAHSIHGFTNSAPDPPLGFLGLALCFEMSVADRLAGVLFDRTRRLFQPALDPLPVHGFLLFNLRGNYQVDVANLGCY